MEDDWATHDALRKIFMRRGWQVESAMTVAGGLVLVESEPDCLVLDLMLPDGDGTAILRRVRQAKLRTRVAVCTGMADVERLSEVESLRPDALLQKPVDFHALCRVCGVPGGGGSVGPGVA